MLTQDEKVLPSKYRTAMAFGTVVAILLFGAITSPTWAAQTTEVTNFGSNPGNLKMYKYVPDNLRASAPLVVALHGCGQTARDYDDETGWTELAEKLGFLLMLAEQKRENNDKLCFRWYEPNHQERDRGEALSIKQMVDKMTTDHRIDSKRIYVTGLSAGGAMTSVMLATYPDVFAGGGIIAGIPYKCASTFVDGFICMSTGANLSTIIFHPNPDYWGGLVQGASNHSGPWPKVSIVQGTSDFIVAEVNAEHEMEQWTHVHGTDQEADVQDTVKGYPHAVYKDSTGNAVVEVYKISNMGHGTPVDPGQGADQCGSAHPYILDVNFCSSYFIGTFWGLVDKGR